VASLHDTLFTSGTKVNGTNADLLKAVKECNEDHNARNKVDQDDKTSISLDQFYGLIGVVTTTT
jgi:hypothetical protein